LHFISKSELILYIIKTNVNRKKTKQQKTIQNIDK
jgi:hypothetical protein